MPPPDLGGSGSRRERLATSTSDRMPHYYPASTSWMPATWMAARIEIGLRHFLNDGGFGAFTDNFQDLHGLAQLPGVGVQRLMADGYGFGAEGDRKTAALVRATKVMSVGLAGGTSFMEDYSYHRRNGGQVLGAHMLEVCPSIAAAHPALEVHLLSIGGKNDPVRLFFNSRNGPAEVASLVDMVIASAQW
jgi:L-arabinose isomerase